MGQGRKSNLGLAEANYYRGWINNKVLRYSTGNYIQYPMITGMEKNMKKNVHTYIYIYN